jgi:DNA polymerase-3 subunit delta
MVITLTGSNSFLLRRRLNELISKFSDKYGELAVERIDAAETDAQAIIDAISSLPFLTSRKMVLLRDASLNKPAVEQIEQIISAADKTTELILYDPAVDKRTSYFKVLKSQTQLEEFEEMDSRQLARWLVNEAKAQGGSLPPPEANYLVERVGANQELLANELTKLIIYNPTISKESIQLLTEPTPQSRIFDLLDASFGGDKKRALRLYEEQRAQKVEPQAILAMIAWQLQLISVAKAGKGRPAVQISKDSGINPYPLQKATALANKLSDEKIRQLVSEALQIDLGSKTTALDLDEALKTYIVTI